MHIYQICLYIKLKYLRNLFKGKTLFGYLKYYFNEFIADVLMDKREKENLYDW